MDNQELLTLTFEEALKRLEEVVDTLESGEVPLETAINLFQEGMQLSQICGQKLDKVEQKIETLMEENGKMVVKPLELEEDRK
jgi:exodeoxyribonuclease VII small subunit